MARIGDHRDDAARAERLRTGIEGLTGRLGASHNRVISAGQVAPG
jgi:hypothetical protein